MNLQPLLAARLEAKGPVRVGLIGAGWYAAENHIPVLARHFLDKAREALASGCPASDLSAGHVAALVLLRGARREVPRPRDRRLDERLPDPAGGPHIRTLEWKHMMPPEEIPHLKGTVLTRPRGVSTKAAAGFVAQNRHWIASRLDNLPPRIGFSISCNIRS